MLVIIILLGCRSEDLPKKEQENINAKISVKKLDEIPDLITLVDDIKSELKKSNNLLNRGIEDLDLDEDHIIVMDLQDNGRTISINVNHNSSGPTYFVMNLNILQHDGIETYYLTKYIPSDGKPFYTYSNFIGTVEVYDLTGNLLFSSSHLGREDYFTLGCYAYVINDNAGFWQVQSVACVYGCDCSSGGGGGSSSGGSTGGGGSSGGNGSTGNGDGGYNGGGGGGDGPGGPPIVPNIPTENFMEQRRYEAFLNQLSQSQLQFLAEYPDYNNNVFNYVKANNFNPSHYTLMSVVINHLVSNTNNNGVHIAWGDLQPMFGFVKKFLQDNPDTENKEQIFERIKALDILLKQNPNALLDIPCTQLSQWQDVSNYQVPQSVKNKINSIPNQNSYWSSWAVTDLESGAGVRVNMDLFPIKITNMPNKPNGQKYTPAEFFDFFRKNINLFAEQFTPIEDNTYNIHDTALWNSSNPLGALIHISIPLDNGTVVCSGFSTNTWIFTTMKAPLGWSYDGIHPVAGNRKFSLFRDDNDGSYTIYTRGVDRFSSVADNSTPLINYLMESSAFLGADELWSGMQNKLSAFINNNGGNASPVTAVKYRPSYNKIKAFLKNQVPLSSLGCH